VSMHPDDEDPSRTYPLVVANTLTRTLTPTPTLALPLPLPQTPTPSPNTYP